MQVISKVYIFFKIYKKIKCEKKLKKDVTFNHGSKIDGTATCILICLKTIFVHNYRYLQNYMYLEQCTSCFLMHKNPIT